MLLLKKFYQLKNIFWHIIFWIICQIPGIKKLQLFFYILLTAYDWNRDIERSRKSYFDDNYLWCVKSESCQI